MTDPSQPRSGDRCPRCDGKITVTTTIIKPPWRTRYHSCRKCGYTPLHNKSVIPLEFAPSRAIPTGRNPVERESATSE